MTTFNFMNIKFWFIFIFFCLQLETCVNASTHSVAIIQKPILFNQERIELTQEYRRIHYGLVRPSIKIVPQMIVLHWTARSFKDSFDLMYPATIHETRADIKSNGLLNVSAHFLVSSDGTIYQLMPSNWMARHVIGLNNIAIGIENVGGIDGRDDLTKAQVIADANLIRYLVKQYPTIPYLIGHYEYNKFKNTSLWEEKNSDYFTQKSDPGIHFMKNVRLQVKDLSLLGPPK